MPGILGITFEEFVEKLQDSNTKVGKGDMISRWGKPCCIAGHALKAMVLDHKDALGKRFPGQPINFRSLCKDTVTAITCLLIAFDLTLNQAREIIRINDRNSTDRLRDLRDYAHLEHI